MSVRPVNMDFRYGTTFGLHLASAYERLLLDCMLGDPDPVRSRRFRRGRVADRHAVHGGMGSRRGARSRPTRRAPGVRRRPTILLLKDRKHWRLI